jgi:sugar/nucleoside kinase (ribokinase family)
MPVLPSPEVVSMGNMLVEVMRTQRDVPLSRPGEFAGPYPSGDTCIYIDSLARLGRQGGFIGAVGDDDFGRCLLERFAADGVDFSCGRVLRGYTTGTAFIAYFGDGSRRFVFHWRHSAAGQLSPDFVRAEYFRDTRWLHLTGCNLAITPDSRDACLAAMRAVDAEAIVSFDPNIRPELLSVEQIRELVRPVIERANLIFPSLGEAAMLTGEARGLAGDEAGCRRWAAQGKTVVLKQGESGCRVFTTGGDFAVPGFPVQEVDPTGAGDTFCAAFTVALLDELERGRPDLVAAARFANAAGALAVTRLGPMEGAPTRAQVLDLLQNAPAGHV